MHTFLLRSNSTGTKRGPRLANKQKLSAAVCRSGYPCLICQPTNLNLCTAGNLLRTCVLIGHHQTLNTQPVTSPDSPGSGLHNKQCAMQFRTLIKFLQTKLWKQRFFNLPIQGALIGRPTTKSPPNTLPVTSPDSPGPGLHNEQSTMQF